MKLLQIEYKKIVGNKSFKVFSLMFLVFLPLLIILVPALVGDTINGVGFYPLVPSSYELTWYTTSVISSWFCFFLLSFVLIYHITNEYSYRTVRQNVIDGFTRIEYLKGKLLLMLAITLIATAYVFIVGLIGGLYFSTIEHTSATLINIMSGTEGEVAVIEDFGSVFDGVSNVFRFFIQTVGGFSFAFFVAFALRKGILAVLIFYSAFLVELIARAILRGRNLEFINDYLPLNSIKNTLRFPNFVEIFQGISSPDAIDWIAVVLTLVYSALFIYLAKALFFKRDIS